MIPGRPQERSQVIFAKVLRPFSTNLACPLGPRKEQKSTHRPTKCPGWRILSDFYIIFGLAHFLDWISDPFSMKNWGFFRCEFSELPDFFSTWRPSWNIVIYVSGDTFPFFNLYIFHRKIIKIQWKAATMNQTQKMTPGGTQNDPHVNAFFRYFGWTGENRPQKVRVWRVYFLTDFWICKTHVPRSHG